MKKIRELEKLKQLLVVRGPFEDSSGETLNTNLY